MAVIPYSAFDPIFWLHHTNFDRLIAIWQALYPDSWASTSQVDSAGTYTDEPGAPEDGSTSMLSMFLPTRIANLGVDGIMLTVVFVALTPSHSDSIGGLYTSYSARYTWSFGYTYPEIVDWDISATDLTSNVRAKFNALYGSNPSTNIKARASSTKFLQLSRRQIQIGFEWYARFTVERCEVPLSFMVHVFLGPIPSNTSTWSYAANLVGSQAFLMTSHANITRLGQARGQIPLNKKLEQAGISCQSQGPVLAHLSTSLTWALQHLNGTPVEVSAMPSFRFFVSQQTIKA